MATMTILTNESYMVYEVFITDEEEQKFVNNTPEWELNQFFWYGISSEDELKHYTFYNREQVEKVNKVYPNFKTNITVEEYDNLIEKLPLTVIKKYFNFTDTNYMLCRYVNTKDLYVWHLPDNIKEIAMLPLK